MNPDEPKQLDVPSFAAHSTRGLIRDRKTRRRIMLVAIVLAIGLLVFGMMLPPDHAIIALVAFFACAWMTITSVLLAIYDLLASRREERVLRQELERQVTQRD